MKSVIAAAVAAFVFAGAASAAGRGVHTFAETPASVAPVYNWSGLYGGINGGLGTSNKCWGDPASPATAGCDTTDGGIGGGQIGFRLQTGRLVFGLEAQGDWANLQGNHVDPNNARLTLYNHLSGLWLLTGQVGYTWNAALLYFKGGAAVTRSDYSTTFDGIFDGGTGVQEQWNGNVGVGFEYGFAPHWSAGIEYNHLFMDGRVYTVGRPLDEPVQFNGDVDLITARVNYHFN
ncbi:MAG: porin family protein [Xanthobacteraceae bacterium]|nr:porin family protein [Xanthobacteraceae bacterium]